jgi:hypothetical protein
MQLDDRVFTHTVPELKAATITTYERATWVSVTVTDPQVNSATSFVVARRATATATTPTTTTTTDTGIRREHAGGIIIGVSVTGLILLIFLAWCCSSRRRQPRFSDTPRSSRSTLRPSSSPRPKAEYVATSSTVSPPSKRPIYTAPPPPPPKMAKPGYKTTSSNVAPPSQHPVFTAPPTSSNFPLPSQQPIHTAPPQPPSKLAKPGYQTTSSNVPQPSQQPTFAEQPLPPKAAKLELAHIIPEVTKKEYPLATYKTTLQKRGMKVAVGGPKEEPKRGVLGWTRPRKSKNLEIPRDDINTLESDSEVIITSAVSHTESENSDSETTESGDTDSGDTDSGSTDSESTECGTAESDVQMAASLRLGGVAWPIGGAFGHGA